MDDLDSSLHLPPPLLPSGNDKKPRRRTREVSSRYMSTPAHPSPANVIPSSSLIISHCGDHINRPASSPRVGYPLPPSSLFANTKRHHNNPKPRRIPPSSPDADAATDSELDSSYCFSRYADENNPPVSVVRRSLETPLSNGVFQCRTHLGTHTKKRAVVRLFSDNSEHDSQHHQWEQCLDQPPNLKTITDPRRKPRLGTPMVSANTINTKDISSPRWTSARRNLLKSNHQLLASTVTVSNPTAPATRTNPRPPTPARQNLFTSEVNESNSDSGLDDAFSDNASNIVDFSDSENCSVSSQGGLCDSPPLPGASTRAARSAIDLRSSMSARRMADGTTARTETAGEQHSSSSCRTSTNSLCYLNSALSSSQQHVHDLMNKFMNRAFIPSKPPQAPSTKQGLETRTWKKASISQNVHMLRLLDNSYVQWRFINATARAAVEARSTAAQRSLHGIQSRISELQASVVKKKVELQQLQRGERFSSTLECQMPYLEEWTTQEETYSNSLSAATKALKDASTRLPITGNVKVDAEEIKDVLNGGELLLESLSPCVGRFLSNAEGVEDEVSELAKLVSNEKNLMELCGNLLSETHILQVKECSLRSQLMQLKQPDK